jgi:rhodanese-related sulfurtransferase
VPIVFFDPSGGPAQANADFTAIVRRHVDPARRLFVGCQSGVRSQRAAEQLAAAGYTNLTNVRGGFGGARDRSGKVVTPGWRESGLPVETGPPQGRSYRDLASSTRARDS